MSKETKAKATKLELAVLFILEELACNTEGGSQAEANMHYGELEHEISLRPTPAV